MYEEHREFQPPSPKATLWRYMDFTKFVSLLDKGALFFSRVDKLGDPFEGSVSIINQFMRPFWLQQGGMPPEYIDEATKNLSEGKKIQARKILVNCWHENDSESEAMWKLYGVNSGVAVKTTFDKLSKCFTGETIIFIAKINYVDHNTTPIDEKNVFAPVLCKRKSFEHEREVRVVMGDLLKRNDDEKYIEVDISRLIEEVVVAPHSPLWLANLVESVADKYELNAPVSRSSMEARPIW